MTEPDLAGQIAEVRRLLEVGFATTNGQLALLLQRTEQGERRHDELAAKVDRQHLDITEKFDDHEDRLRACEQDRATTAGAQQHSKRQATWTALGVSTLGVVASIVFDLIGKH